MSETSWYDALTQREDDGEPERRPSGAFLAHLAAGGSPLTFPSKRIPVPGARARLAALIERVVCDAESKSIIKQAAE